jgi:release factor glutamine methyltransferase
VALALARQLGGAEVFASDVSEGALAVAEDNARRLGLAVTFVRGHLAEPLAGHAPFDLVAANLPYVPSADIDGLAAEVRSEPRLALDGGADGLALVRELLGQARALLRPGGCLALEIGAGQARTVAEGMRARGFSDVRTRCDLGGVERVVSGRAGEPS